MLRPALVAALLALGVASSPGSAAPARAAGSPVKDCRARVAGLDLQTATVRDLQAAMAAGRLTSRRLTQAYLERIRAYDRAVNSVRALSPRALAIADQMDRERRAGRVRGPMHGIPVLLKDNIGTTDVPTTAGSIALAGSIPKREAFVTERLRAAGAVVLGKTNLSEFANWVALGMPSGYSSLGGQVRNAYHFGDPSGSSSGSGVAGSMAFATATLGSETSGSILSPSTANALVGVKPTMGLVSRAGVIPLAPSFDVVGPMTRNVPDAAAVLTAIAGADPRDPETTGAKPADYFSGLRGASLKGVRLGYDDSVNNGLFTRALDDLRRAGAVLVPTDVVAYGGLVGLTEIAEIPNEFKASLNTYLAEEVRPGLRSGVRTLSDIIEFNKRHPDKLKYGQNLLEASNATPGSMLLATPPAAVTRASSRAVIDAALIKDDLDAIVAPGPGYANAGAAAGYPTVVVPSGASNDGTRPAGLAFLGTGFSEQQLLRYAAAYEQATQRRIPPTAVNDELIRGC